MAGDTKFEMSGDVTLDVMNDANIASTYYQKLRSDNVPQQDATELTAKYMNDRMFEAHLKRLADRDWEDKKQKGGFD